MSFIGIDDGIEGLFKPLKDALLEGATVTGISLAVNYLHIGKFVGEKLHHILHLSPDLIDLAVISGTVFTSVFVWNLVAYWKEYYDIHHPKTN